MMKPLETEGILPGLDGARIRLRAPERSDADRRLRLGYDAGILRAYGVEASGLGPMTPARAAAWLEEQRRIKSSMIDLNGAMIGTIRLHSHDRTDARAQLAIGLVDPEMLGQGYGREALKLVLDHAFGKLGLHRISLRVLASNERAVRTYTSLRFVIEGREREAAQTDWGRQDDLIMGLLASEWAS